MKLINLLFSLLLFSSFSMEMLAQFEPSTWRIPVEGNSFVTKQSSNSISADNNPEGPVAAVLERGGLLLKNDTGSVVSTYIYICEPATPLLSIRTVGKAKLRVSCNDQHFTADVDSKEPILVEIGKLNVKQAGYVRIDFQLVDIAQPTYAIVRHLVLSGMSMKPLFISKNYSAYFGARGPSVHLVYNTKSLGEADWVYNEVRVPEEGDIVGSYYCSLGFDGGYFGFQHNTPTERKILFSVWNAMDSDNPKDVSPEYRTKILSSASGTDTGSFGNEGSGKQCFLKYDWKPGQTYGFLLHAVKTGQDATDYSAYFYDKEKDSWYVLATMRRPHTGFLLSGLYSFVENFDPRQGYLPRFANYGNMWVKVSEKWSPMRRALFSNDDTGRRGIRVDYDGGVDAGRFYLKMGGFFGNGSNINRDLRLPDLSDEEINTHTIWLEKQIKRLNEK